MIRGIKRGHYSFIHHVFSSFFVLKDAIKNKVFLIWYMFDFCVHFVTGELKRNIRWDANLRWLKIPKHAIFFPLKLIERCFFKKKTALKLFHHSFTAFSCCMSEINPWDFKKLSLESPIFKINIFFHLVQTNSGSFHAAYDNHMWYLKAMIAKRT